MSPVPGLLRALRAGGPRPASGAARPSSCSIESWNCGRTFTGPTTRSPGPWSPAPWSNFESRAGRSSSPGERPRCSPARQPAGTLWGQPCFEPATRGALDALQKSMDLHNGGDANDWFFVAMAHHDLGNHAEARRWLDRADRWTIENAVLPHRAAKHPLRGNSVSRPPEALRRIPRAPPERGPFASGRPERPLRNGP